METCSVVLIFESVEDSLCCDYSNATYSAAFLHDTAVYLFFNIISNKIWIFLKNLIFDILGLKIKS